jgi:hypothetical protein
VFKFIVTSVVESFMSKNAVFKNIIRLIFVLFVVLAAVILYFLFINKQPATVDVYKVNDVYGDSYTFTPVAYGSVSIHGKSQFSGINEIRDFVCKKIDEYRINECTDTIPSGTNKIIRVAVVRQAGDDSIQLEREVYLLEERNGSWGVIGTHSDHKCWSNRGESNRWHTDDCI